MKYILANKNLTLLFISIFLFFFSDTLLFPTLPLFLSELNYSNLQIGTVLGVFALGVLALRPLAGVLTDRKGRKISLLIGLFIFFITPPLYLVSESFIYLLFVRFFHGIGITFFSTSYPTMITDIAPADRRGEIIGHMGIFPDVIPCHSSYGRSSDLHTLQFYCFDDTLFRYWAHRNAAILDD